MSEPAGTLERDDAVAAAVKRQKQRLTDAHVTDYDYVDSESGHKMQEETVAGPQGTEHSFEIDATKLYTVGPSTTGNVEILRIEAELADDGADLANPHIPIDESTWAKAVERLEREGLDPAWTDGGGSA